MSNNITAFNPEYWSKRMQVVRIKEPVYRALANFEERSNLKDGDTVHRPYRSKLRVMTYTKGTDVSLQDVTSTDESLTVSTTKIVPFYVDNIDKIQNKWDAANAFADDAGRELEAYIDGDFLSEVANARDTVDDGDLGGTAGNAIALTTSNILKTFAVAGKKLTNQLKGVTRDMKGKFAVITPTVHQILIEYLAGKDTNLADTVGQNGKVGTFLGFDLHLSVNTYWTGKWTPANDPSDGDTLTINGVTLTFETGTPTNPGDVKATGTTATSLDNLVAALNAPSTTTANFIAVSDADAAKLTGVVATDGTTFVTLAFDGGGEVAVSGSEAADVWSATISHLMFGLKGCVDLVIQKEPSVEFRDPPLKLGKNVLPWTLYGLKTFEEGKDMMVDVQLDSSQF